MQIGDERGVVLARGDGGDLDVRMAQEDFDKFEGGVTGAAEDGCFYHSRVRPSVKQQVYLQTQHGPKKRVDVRLYLRPNPT